jgi:hypothetical protein
LESQDNCLSRISRSLRGSPWLLICSEEEWFVDFEIKSRLCWNLTLVKTIDVGEQAKYLRAAILARSIHCTSPPHVITLCQAEGVLDFNGVLFAMTWSGKHSGDHR